MKKLESSLLNMVLVLTAISLIAGGTLAYINKVTQGPIAEINAKNLQDGIKKVILGGQPGDLKVEEPVESNGYTLYKTDKGTAVKAVTNGFGGPLAGPRSWRDWRRPSAPCRRAMTPPAPRTFSLRDSGSCCPSPGRWRRTILVLLMECT